MGLKENRLIAFEWKPGDSTTKVSISLTPSDGGTQVQIVEQGYSTSEADLAALVDCASGWGEALTLLKVYLEHGICYHKNKNE